MRAENTSVKSEVPVSRLSQPFVERNAMLLFLFLALLQPALVAAWGYCNDKDISCANWANGGQCVGENADHLKQTCPHSCSMCSACSPPEHLEPRCYRPPDLPPAPARAHAPRSTLDRGPCARRPHLPRSGAGLPRLGVQRAVQGECRLHAQAVPRLVRHLQAALLRQGRGAVRLLGAQRRVRQEPR